MGISATGTLESTSIAQLMASISVAQVTGTLVLTQDDRQVTLWWKKGTVVAAESPFPDDQLGRVLLAQKWINKQQLAKSLELMAQTTGLSQIEALVKLGAVPADRAPDVAKLEMIAKAMRAFQVPFAAYSVLPKPNDQHAESGVPASWLILQGVRRYYDEARLARETTSLMNVSVRLLPSAQALLPTFGFDDTYRGFLARLPSFTKVTELLAHAEPLSHHDALATVFSLFVTGCFEVATGATAASVGVATPTQRATTTPGTQPAPPSASRATPLTNPKPAPVASSRVRIPATIPAKSVPPVPKVSNVASNEPAKLGNVTSAMVLAKHKSVVDGANLFAVLDLREGATEADIKKAYFEMAKIYHPDRLASHGLEGLRPQVEQVFARVTEAFSVLGNPTERRKYQEILAAGGEEAVHKRVQAEEAMAMKIVAAEEKFMLGEMALRRQSFGQARDLFKEAIDLNPDEGEHHAAWAWATWCSATDKAAVARECKNALGVAIKRNGKCAPAFYYTGQILKQEGDVQGALTAFKKAIELRRSYAEAESEVRLLEQRTAKGDKKKGLFGR